MRLKFRDEASRVLLAAMLFGAGSAAAQDYPSATEAVVLSGWLGENTNIAPAAVVSVTPELVVALVGKTTPATPGGPVRLTLREEVIAPGYVQTVGGRSSLMSMEIHCEERRVRMDERRLYSGLNLTGAVEISDPSAEWVRIPEGSIMDEVARAACDAEYPWPLRFAGATPAAPSATVVAALETPALTLPPGPDAKLIADEPPPAEEKVLIEAPPVPEPETNLAAETAVEAAPEVETTPPPPQEPDTAVVEPAVETEIAASPEPEEVAAPSPEQTVAVAEPVTPEIAPTEAPEQTVASPEIIPQPELSTAAETAPQPAPEPEPATPAPPTDRVFAVQIGAYETREMAEAAWAALSANRPILVDGLSFEIRPVRVKGKDWLRGLVGRFATRKEAGAFCTAIAGAEYGCILRPLAD